MFRDWLDRHLQPLGIVGLPLLLAGLWALVSSEPLIPSILSFLGAESAAHKVRAMISAIPRAEIVSYASILVGGVLVITVMWRTRQGAIALVEAKARLAEVQRTNDRQEHMIQKQADRREADLIEAKLLERCPQSSKPMTVKQMARKIAANPSRGDPLRNVHSETRHLVERQIERDAEVRRVIQVFDDMANEMAVWVAEQRERPIAERNQGSPGYVADYVRAWRMRFQHRLETFAQELKENPDVAETAQYALHCARAADIEAFEGAVATLRSMAKALGIELKDNA